jgi:hypothetical protein
VRQSAVAAKISPICASISASVGGLRLTLRKDVKIPSRRALSVWDESWKIQARKVRDVPNHRAQ